MAKWIAAAKAVVCPNGTGRTKVGANLYPPGVCVADTMSFSDITFVFQEKSERI